MATGEAARKPGSCSRPGCRPRFPKTCMTEVYNPVGQASESIGWVAGCEVPPILDWLGTIV